MEQTSRSQIFEHLGLVAGMFAALGIGDVMDKATQQNPDMQIVTAGNAVQAMGRNGLGFVNQRLSLVPQFFQNTPTSRLIAPAIAPAHLHDDTLGRAFETLYDYGVTALSSLIAATAAPRLGLSPTFVHLDSPSFHVDGRYNSGEEPDAEVLHITQGYSRDHRPALNQVMLALLVEHQAGMPGWLHPLSGNRSEVTDFGQIVQEHISKLHTTYGTTYLVAESALDSADNLQKLSETHIQGIPRVPATVHDAQTVRAQAVPEAMLPWMEGYRSQEFRSTHGGVQHRWVLRSSALRQPHVQRTVNKQPRKQGDKAVQAFQTLCRVAFACEADAQQALATCAHGVQATCVHERTVRAIPRSGQRGRPRQDAQPAQVTYHLEGALASRLATPQARVDQHSCFLLATNALDDARLSPQALLEGYKGQGQAERGVRFLKAPQFLAASCSLKKPERLMALLRVMTVCLWVYAALEYRIRTALKEHDATFPNQQGQPVQNPTARWVFHDFVGMHVLRIPGQWDSIVLNLTAGHQRLLQLLGKPSTRFYR